MVCAFPVNRGRDGPTLAVRVGKPHTEGPKISTRAFAPTLLSRAEAGINTKSKKRRGSFRIPRLRNSCVRRNLAAGATFALVFRPLVAMIQELGPRPWLRTEAGPTANPGW